ncbi:MAG: hypothetical protein COT74_07760 [Bdellovibrionales bacterium CG10_big_fil_rev_8_21_14_0_10_45_34]|nr:MAG: hypothetical protein COT74_07760 [Bdellovibrionales bacterium CG10_big_fil_rev_8_21_14_0_10_45_34]
MPVKIHMSLIVLALYVVIVTTVWFPIVVGFSGLNISEIALTPFIWSLLFALFLVISVFIHGLSHLVCAKLQRHKVHAMTLMMLGGVSQTDKVNRGPKAELKSAIIGPLISFASAGLFFVLRVNVESPSLQFAFFWIAYANLAIAAFNMLPVFPADGGRVLKAFLMGRKGKVKGTKSAVKLSHVFAALFGVIGVVDLNILLLLIALFIYGAARNELFGLWGRSVLRALKAKNLMTPTPTIPQDATLAGAVAIMRVSENLLLPVSGTPEIGVLIDSDSILKVPQRLWATTLVKDVAQYIPHPVSIEDNLEQAWRMVFTAPAKGVAVFQDQRVIGIVTSSKILSSIELSQLDTKPKPAHIGVKIAAYIAAQFAGWVKQIYFQKINPLFLVLLRRTEGTLPFVKR